MSEATPPPPRGTARYGLLGMAASLLVALPPLGVAAWLVQCSEVPAHAPAVLGAAFGVSVLFAWRSQALLLRRLRTVSSVLASYREGDYSIRARDLQSRPLVDVVGELNQLGDTLREHRLGELEAWTLLRKVMAEVDVVVLAIDDEGRLKLANDAATRALGQPMSAVLGKTAADLGVGDLVAGEAPRVVRTPTPFGRGPWELRRGAFRLSGEPHTLLVLSDLSGALRDQERDAWKRLIRVMGHEINNSLAPIQSISESLARTIGEPVRPEGWENDATNGLSVISRRAEGLGRFMAAYGALARLPPPRLAVVDVSRWVVRAAALEQRVRVEVLGGPDASVLGDADQLDQLLINLIKNAVDAALERDGNARVRWQVVPPMLTLIVEDDGPGLGDTANLFVPFFTTKPGGSGIGLALVRQIAEAHGGVASLQARTGTSGAEAIVRLPLAR